MGAALQGESMDFLDILRHEAKKAKKQKAQAQMMRACKKRYSLRKNADFLQFLEQSAWKARYA